MSVFRYHLDQWFSTLGSPTNFLGSSICYRTVQWKNYILHKYLYFDILRIKINFNMNFFLIFCQIFINIHFSMYIIVQKLWLTIFTMNKHLTLYRRNLIKLVLKYEFSELKIKVFIKQKLSKSTSYNQYSLLCAWYKKFDSIM